MSYWWTALAFFTFGAILHDLSLPRFCAALVCALVIQALARVSA